MMQQQRKESIVSICPGGFVLYELSARPWLYELSAKYQKPISKLSDIPDEEFLALKRRGESSLLPSFPPCQPNPEVLSEPLLICTPCTTSPSPPMTLVQKYLPPVNFN